MFFCRGNWRLASGVFGKIHKSRRLWVFCALILLGGLFLLEANAEPSGSYVLGEIESSNVDATPKVSTFHGGASPDGGPEFLTVLVLGLVLLPLLSSAVWIARKNRRLAQTQSRLIHELKRLEEEQRLSHTVFLQAHAGVMVTDKNNLIVQVNPTFTDITGYSRDEILGKTPDFLSLGYHGKDFYREFLSSLKRAGKWTGEVMSRHKNGHTFVQRISVSQVCDRDGSVIHHIAILTDISLQKQLIEELQYSANHDMLTGLPNRNLLYDRINQAIAQARRSRKGVAIIFLDLDEFKPVNDTHGHAAGDVLLKRIGGRMSKVIRAGDTVARVGGDEFVVVVNELEAEEGAIQCAEKILAAINRPVDLQRGGPTAQVSASLGVLLIFPYIIRKASTISPERLVEQADMLMYQAKHAGRARMVVQLLNSGNQEH